MARVAVFHNTLDFRGGADVVCLEACAALAREHDVTLYTISRTDPRALASRFDVPFDATVVQPPGARAVAGAFETLGSTVGPQLAARTALLRAFFRGHADAYDAALSTANEVSLPLPSVQYVHFPQFNLDRTTEADPGRLDWLWNRLAAPPAASAPAAPAAQEPTGRSDQHPTRLVANSSWTADVVDDIYGERPAVCHPPVDPIPGREWSAREHGVLVLGRIAPDKRVLDAIAVVDALRDRGYDLTCRVVGSAPPAYRDYVAEVERATDAREHVALETDVDRDRVLDLLGRYRYGLNMKRTEHFGMAVAEYVAAGMLPFAPDDGGQVDVLAGDDRLLFPDADGAIQRIADAVDADRRPFLPRDRFDRDRFATEIREHVTAIMK
jgi:glycosyltransferase involved in cell wall biosynthesis